MPAVVGHENVIRSPWGREAVGPTKLFLSWWYLECEALLTLQQSPHWITIPRPLPETAYAVYSQRSYVPEHEDTPFRCNAGPQNVKDNVLGLIRSPLLSAAHEQYLPVRTLYRTCVVLLCFRSRRLRSKGPLRIPLLMRPSVWPYLSPIFWTIHPNWHDLFWNYGNEVSNKVLRVRYVDPSFPQTQRCKTPEFGRSNSVRVCEKCTTFHTYLSLWYYKVKVVPAGLWRHTSLTPLLEGGEWHPLSRKFCGPQSLSVRCG